MNDRIWRSRDVTLSTFSWCCICLSIQLVCMGNLYASPLSPEEEDAQSEQYETLSGVILILPLLDSENLIIDDQERLSLSQRRGLEPRIGYRWGDLTPMVGLNYYGVHRLDELRGDQSLGVIQLGLGLKYTFIQRTILNSFFEGFLSLYLFKPFLLTDDEEEGASRERVNEAGWGGELSLGGMHILSPHFSIGGALCFTRYMLSDEGGDGPQLQTTWYSTFGRLLLEITF